MHRACPRLRKCRFMRIQMHDDLDSCPHLLQLVRESFWRTEPESIPSVNTEEAGGTRLPGPELGQPLHRRQPHPGRCPQVHARLAPAAYGPPCSLPCSATPAHSGTRLSCRTYIMHGATNPTAEHLSELIWPEPYSPQAEDLVCEKAVLSTNLVAQHMRIKERVRHAGGVSCMEPPTLC